MEGERQDGSLNKKTLKRDAGGGRRHFIREEGEPGSEVGLWLVKGLTV